MPDRACTGYIGGAYPGWVGGGTPTNGGREAYTRVGG